MIQKKKATTKKAKAKPAIKGVPKKKGVTAESKAGKKKSAPVAKVAKQAKSLPKKKTSEVVAAAPSKAKKKVPVKKAPEKKVKVAKQPQVKVVDKKKTPKASKSKNVQAKVIDVVVAPVKLETPKPAKLEKKKKTSKVENHEAKNVEAPIETVEELVVIEEKVEAKIEKSSDEKKPKKERKKNKGIIEEAKSEVVESELMAESERSLDRDENNVDTVGKEKEKEKENEFPSAEEINNLLKDIDFFDNDDTDECYERSCENLQTTLGFCRFHYIKNWKHIRKKKEIIKNGKLQELIIELILKYPLKYVEAMHKDLSGDKEFVQVLKDLNIESNYGEEEASEIDMDDDISVETRTYASGRMKFEEDEEI